MAGILRDITLSKKLALFDIWIIGGLGLFVVVFRPVDESRDRAPGAIAIVNDKIEAFGARLVLRRRERSRGVEPQPTSRGAIARNGRAGEIIGAGLAV